MYRLFKKLSDSSDLNTYDFPKDIPSSLFVNLPATSSSTELTPLEVDQERKEDLDVEWTDIEIAGLWGHHGLELDPWDDDEKPLVTLKAYGELRLTPLEETGVLTHKIAASCASYLDRSPETKKFVICKYNLSNKMLRDISILEYYHYVQYLDLSWNELETLEALGQMPFLMYLNASHNDLTEVLDFKAPFNLTYVDLSFNRFTSIPNLTDFWSIVHLDLSHNLIPIIEGLQNLKYLRFLNLSFNEISTIANLNNLRIQTLCLQHNHIYKFEEGPDVGLNTLHYLKFIKLSYNHLDTLKLFDNVGQLQSIEMSNNHISSLLEIYYMRNMRYLTNVDFTNNPITKMPHYLDVCLDTMKYLIFLDGEPTDAIQKTAAFMKFNNSPEILASRLNAKTMLLQQINNPYIGLPVFPYTNPAPPILILVGPPSSKKSELVKRLCKEVTDTVLGVSHTTKQKSEGDIDGEDYYYLSYDAFRDLLRHGKFLTVVEHFGNCYGFTESELVKICEKGILVFHTDLSAALTLRARGLRPYLVLAIPSHEDTHLRWLHGSYMKTKGQSEKTNTSRTSNESSGTKEDDKKTVEKIFLQDQDSSLISEDILAAAGYVDNRCVVIVESSLTMDEKDDSEILSPIESGSGLQQKNFSGILKGKGHKRQKTSVVTFKTSSRQDSSGELEDGDDIEIFLEPPEDMFDLNIRSISQQVVRSLYNPILSAVSELHFQSQSRLREEQSKISCAYTTYQKDVLALRKSYLEIHFDNPGLFSRVVFTDDENKSMDILRDLVTFIKDHQKNMEAKYDLQLDNSYSEMLSHKVNLMLGRLKLGDIDTDCDGRKMRLEQFQH